MTFKSTWRLELSGEWSAAYADDVNRGEMRIEPSGRGRNRSYSWETTRHLVRNGVDVVGGTARSLDAAKAQAEAAIELLGRPL